MANDQKTEKRAAQKQAFRERAVLAYAPVTYDSEADGFFGEGVQQAIRMADLLTAEMYPPEPDQEKHEAAPATNSVA